MIVRIATVVFSVLAVFNAVLPTLAQGSSSSSESSSYRRGYGSTNSNVFVPKYRERLQAWTEQIGTGRDRGWLTPAEVDRFTGEHARLAALNINMEAQNYPKAETDSMEHQFNSFNVLLSQAMSKPIPTVAPPAIVPANISPVAPVATPPVKKASVAVKTVAKSKTSKTAIKKKVTVAKKTAIKKS